MLKGLNQLVKEFNRLADVQRSKEEIEVQLLKTGMVYVQDCYSEEDSYLIWLLQNRFDTVSKIEDQLESNDEENIGKAREELIRIISSLKRLGCTLEWKKELA